MKKVCVKYSMTKLCGVFNASISSYYDKSVRPNLVDINVITMIKTVSNESRNSYPKRSVQAELNYRGHKIGLHKTASLRIKANVVIKYCPNLNPIRKVIESDE